MRTIRWLFVCLAVTCLVAGGTESAWAKRKQWQVTFGPDECCSETCASFGEAPDDLVAVSWSGALLAFVEYGGNERDVGVRVIDTAGRTRKRFDLFRSARDCPYPCATPEGTRCPVNKHGYKRTQTANAYLRRLGFSSTPIRRLQEEPRAEGVEFPYVYQVGGLRVVLDAYEGRLAVFNGNARVYQRPVAVVPDVGTERDDCSDHPPALAGVWVSGPWLLLRITFEGQDHCPRNPADLWIGPIRAGIAKPGPASQRAPRGPAP